jgi:hypothetical protein
MKSITIVKMLSLSWCSLRVILGRLPTRANLLTRGIIQGGEAALCLPCLEASESENHLFVSCPYAWKVWALVHRWFGLSTVLPNSIPSRLEGFLSIYRKGKHGFQGVLLVWRARNEKIFEAKLRTLEEIFEKIQLISWKWLLSKKANSPCLFYEWCVFPFDCIVR